MHCADPPIVARKKDGDRQRQEAAPDLHPGPILPISSCPPGFDCPARRYIFGP